MANIRLKVYDTNHRRDYLGSLPLHWTQQETEQHTHYSVFENTSPFDTQMSIEKAS